MRNTYSRGILSSLSLSSSTKRTPGFGALTTPGGDTEIAGDEEGEDSALDFAEAEEAVKAEELRYFIGGAEEDDDENTAGDGPDSMSSELAMRRGDGLGFCTPDKNSVSISRPKCIDLARHGKERGKARRKCERTIREDFCAVQR